jgi:hypothetical protein
MHRSFQINNWYKLNSYIPKDLIVDEVFCQIMHGVMGRQCKIANLKLNLGLNIYNLGVKFTVKVWQIEAISTGLCFDYENMCEKYTLQNLEEMCIFRIFTYRKRGL